MNGPNGSAPSAPPGVSVVVPTLNRGDFLMGTLNSLFAQTHRPLEIILVDQSDAPDPRVDAVVAAHPDIVRHLRVTFRNLPQARNYGWQNARQPAVLFVDDDIECGPDLVERHAHALAEPNVGLVAGGIDEPSRPEPDTGAVGAFNRWRAMPHGSFQGRGEADVEHARGCNFSVWRRVLREVGGFDETLGQAASLFEELDCCLRVRRAGYRIVFRGEARLVHLVAPLGGCRVDEQARAMWGMARNRGILIRRYLRWYEKPVACLYQVWQSARIAQGSRAFSVFSAGMRGAVTGWKLGGAPPLCTPVSSGDAAETPSAATP